MGLLGIDANSSSSSLNQAQVSTQYGNAFGANTGKGAASSNASGSTTIGGGVKVGKGATLTISTTNTQLENSIAEGLTNIQSLLQGGNAQGGDSGTSSSGLGGLLGGSSSKSGAGGKGGDGGDVTGGNIAVTPALGLLEGNQGLSATPTNELVDALNSGGSSDISDTSHPHADSGGFIFSPTSTGATTTGASTFPWLPVILGVSAIGGIVLAIKYFKQ